MQIFQGPRTETEKKVSSSAEDEGISFSERSSSPEDPPMTDTNNINNTQDNDQETTIDDVIEELRIIVKDAEEELHDWNQLQRREVLHKNEIGKNVAVISNVVVKKQPKQQSKARECLRNTEESARLDRGIKGNGRLKIAVPGPQQVK